MVISKYYQYLTPLLTKKRYYTAIFWAMHQAYGPHPDQSTDIEFNDVTITNLIQQNSNYQFDPNQIYANFWPIIAESVNFQLVNHNWQQHSVATMYQKIRERYHIDFE